jgi:hypothetical protein
MAGKRERKEKREADQNEFDELFDSERVDVERQPCKFDTR